MTARDVIADERLREPRIEDHVVVDPVDRDVTTTRY